MNLKDMFMEMDMTQWQMENSKKMEMSEPNIGLKHDMDPQQKCPLYITETMWQDLGHLKIET